MSLAARGSRPRRLNRNWGWNWGWGWRGSGAWSLGRRSRLPAHTRDADAQSRHEHGGVGAHPVLVRIKDQRPLGGVSVDPGGDVRERLAFLDGVVATAGLRVRRPPINPNRRRKHHGRNEPAREITELRHPHPVSPPNPPRFCLALMRRNLQSQTNQMISKFFCSPCKSRRHDMSRDTLKPFRLVKIFFTPCATPPQ